MKEEIDKQTDEKNMPRLLVTILFNNSMLSLKQSVWASSSPDDKASYSVIAGLVLFLFAVLVCGIVILPVMSAKYRS